MSMFIPAISCLTTSNLPWFMDLTFQVPMQYCSLQHWIMLLSSVPSRTGCCFCFGSIPSFFLQLFLHWSSVVYWAPTHLGSSSFNVLSFCLFILFMGFSRQEYWSGLPFPSLVDHILSDLSTMTCLGWPHMAWLSFIELEKAVVRVIWLASCLWLWFQSVCPLMPSLSAYRLSWVSLTLDMGYLFLAAPLKRSLRSIPWKWGSSSRPLPHPSKSFMICKYLYLKTSLCLLFRVTLLWERFQVISLLATSNKSFFLLLFGLAVSSGSTLTKWWAQFRDNKSTDYSISPSITP